MGTIVKLTLALLQGFKYLNLMIKNSKQNWVVGHEVRVGFLTLRVTGVRAVKDFMPDIYDMESLDGSKRYEFIPHNGLTRVYA